MTPEHTRVSLGARDVRVNALPPAVAQARTYLVWRPGHRSIALDALRPLLGRPTSSARGPERRRSAS